MKNILVPTDFSETASTALNYAMTLAKNLNSKLILFHAYQVAAPIAEVPFGVLNDERRVLKEEAESKLKALSLKMTAAGNIVHECFSAEGEAVETILEAAKEWGADLIILGTNGKSGLSGVIFGSVSLRILEKARCPVMAVPPGFSTAKTIKKITYATDYHRSDLAAIHKAAEIAGASHAELNILHVSDVVIGADEEKTLMGHFMEKVEKSTNYDRLSFQVIHGYNIEARLEEYIEEGATDMLLMATHYRNILDKLFGRSITKNIARESSIPVIAFHYREHADVKLF